MKIFFLNQLKIHFRKKDIAIILSASGNSKNIVKAANWIKKENGYVFSIIGFDGGKLKKISNNYIHIPSIKGEYGPGRRYSINDKSYTSTLVSKKI